MPDLRAVLSRRSFRRLLAVRLVSQAGDGVFQVALASLFFFSPERQSTASGVAAAFAVLLLPFTLVGPWAGVLLDRWRRRQVLVVVNAARALTVVATAWLLTRAGPGVWLYVVVLVVLSANRFLLAGLSASLPHVVRDEALVTANAIAPTAGSAAAFAGGVLAFALRGAAGPGDAGDARLLLLAAGTFALAAALALRLGAAALGPDRADRAPVVNRLAALWRDLAAAVRHLVQARTPATALAAIGAHRAAYGLSLIATILLARNRLTEAGDEAAALALLGVVVGSSGAGFLAAAVVTPVVTRRIPPPAWAVTCLALAAVTETVFVAAMTAPLLVAGAFLLGLAAQGLKISVDTIVQRDVDDAYRGRVFVLYDAVYNAAFVAAAALAVLVVPDDGYSRWLYGGIAAWYAGTAAAYRRASGRG